MTDNPADEDANLAESPLLFNNVIFTIIPTGLDTNFVETLVEDMKANGAEYLPLDPQSGRIREEDMLHLSHIIAATSDFPDYDDAFNRMRHVVKPRWVDVSVTKGKLSNPRQFSPDPSLFMSDVVVTFARDIPEGDKEAIIGAVYAMGGQYSGSLSKMCTHLVALGIDNERCDLVIKKRLNTYIILPHWFDDCLKLGKRIKEHPYVLPDPDVLRLEHGPTLFREKDAYKDIKGASSPVPKQFPSPASSPGPGDKPRALDVFKSKRIFLSPDLRIGSHLKHTLEELVQGGGGEIVEIVGDCDTYIGTYRDGREYTLASRLNKEVGNLSWLYHLIQHNAWTSPLRRLLHYPIPRNGIPGFKSYKMSISNYTGEARTYLESLVKAAGGDFTKTMKQDNTHLITAHMASEKCDAAKEWNINIVNHLWLEESYAKCELQSLTQPRYQHFPKRTNLGEVIGQTRVDKAAIQRFHFGDVDSGPNQPVKKVQSAGQPSKKGVAAIRTSEIRGKSAIVGTTGTDLDDDDAMDTSGIDDQSDLVNPPTYQTESYRPTPRPKKATSLGEVKTPAQSRLVGGKENQTPSTTGSRGAKARALDKLHDSAADIALYEQERKRKGGVVYGGRRVSDPDRVDMSKDGKRKREAEDEDKDEEEVDVPKKGRKTKPNAVERVLLTAYKGFENITSKQEADAKNKLRNMGIHLVESSEKMTILCAPKIVRTRKFVAAIAAAPQILNTEFIDYCLEHGKVPSSYGKYALVDQEAEAKFGFQLNAALLRAQANKGKLMSGFQIFVTDGVQGGFETYRDIIHANGGHPHLYKGTMRVNMAAREDPKDSAIRKNRKHDEKSFVYLISGPKRDQVTLWDKFKDMVRKQDLEPRIVMPDWLLQFAMSQEFSWSDKWALDESKI